MRKVLTWLLVAAAALTLTGCGLADKAIEKATEKAIEKATGVSVNDKTGEVTVKGQDGSTLTMSGDTKEGKVPDGFPIPVYPKAKVVEGSRLTLNGKKIYTVELSFKDNAKAAFEFYQNVLKERGYVDPWTMEDIDSEEESYTLTGQIEKKESFMVLINMDLKTKEGTINLQWSEQ